MPRTLYRNHDTLTLDRGPTDRVTFHLPKNSPKATVPGSRFITVPVGSSWTPGAHWHEEYTEHIRVVGGRIWATIGDTTKDYGPEDGVLTFPKFTIHNFGRADKGAVSGDGDHEGLEDLEIEEWVDPENGFKAVFFYNIFGTFLDSQGQLGTGDVVQLAATLAYVDEYPVIIPGPFFVQSVAIHSLLGVARWVGWACGYRPWLEEYTPRDLWEVAQNRGLLTSTSDRSRA